MFFISFGSVLRLQVELDVRVLVKVKVRVRNATDVKFGTRFTVMITVGIKL